MGRIIWILVLIAGFLNGKDFIKFDEATLIAQNYKKRVQENIFKEWREANISNIEKFYDIEGNIVGYEVSLENESGGFFISNDKNTPLIPIVLENGKSISANLLSYEKKLRKNFKQTGIKVLESRFFISLPVCYGIGFKVDKEIGFLNGVSKENGWFVFSPLKECKEVKYFQNNQKRRSLKFIKENVKLKEKLLKGKGEELFKDIKVKSIKSVEKKRNTKNMGRYNFSDFYQEYRNWSNNGYCVAGCSPVAWAILLEYWDRNGFPKMVGSAYDNDNINTSDPDVRYMIERLREYLGTFCDSDDSGATPRSNMAQGIHYVEERGYPESYAYIAVREDPFSAWMTLMREIYSNRPILASIVILSQNFFHSAVAYKYIDDIYDNNDYFCVKTGWEKDRNRCYNPLYLEQVTVIVPLKSVKEPPVADAGSDKQIKIGQSVILDGSNSMDLDGYIVQYQWSVDNYILGYEKKLKITPDSVGKFEIKLTVTDNDDLSSQDSFTLTVLDDYTPPSPSPNPPVFDNFKMIVSKMNGYCIDISGADSSAGAQLITWPCHGKSNQQWYYDNGQIRSALNGYCIDISGADSSAGAQLITWPCHGKSNQQWYYDNGELKSRLNNYCIDIAKSNSSPGAKLITWPCHGRSNQRWMLK